ncbi:hypothetical protein BBJ28_00016414 [Nothophytophthora sp. Chile5]|nr:hypothetical protein BBJ28_00016414 [Nothophytophthora sp. Chile5]
MQGGAVSQPPELLAYKALQAVHRGNAEELKKLLEAGADAHVINAVVKAGSTTSSDPSELIAFVYTALLPQEAKGSLLYHAVDTQNVELVKVLLSNGAEVNGSKQDEVADVNARDSNGDSPLHVHAAKWNASFVNSLVEYGADVNALDKVQQAIARWDCDTGSNEEEFMEVCRVLMMHKAGRPHADPSHYSNLSSEAEKLVPRLQLVKEWAAQCDSGSPELTPLPVEVFRQGASEITAYFAASGLVPMSIQAPALEAGETAIEEFPGREQRPLRINNEAWGPKEDLIQRRVEKLPALTIPPGTEAVIAADNDEVNPIPSISGPDAGLCDESNERTVQAREAEGRWPRSSSPAWGARDEVIAGETDLPPVLGKLPEVGSGVHPIAPPLETATEILAEADVRPMSSRGEWSLTEKFLSTRGSPPKTSQLLQRSAPVACEAPPEPVAPPLSAPQMRRYHMKIVGASNLCSVTMFQSQSPYCICQFVDGDGSAFLQFETSAHSKGGQNPVWNKNLFEVVLPLRYTQNCTLVFVVKSSRVVKALEYESLSLSRSYSTY